jgi:hypothetical protein
LSIVVLSKKNCTNGCSYPKKSKSSIYHVKDLPSAPWCKTRWQSE